MDWFFCSACSKPKQVIQQYHPNEQSKVRLLSTRQVKMGKATFQDTMLNIKRQMQKLKPRNQYDLKNGKEGFSIEQMKKNKSAANGVFKKIQKSKYEQILKQCQKTGKPWKDPEFNYEKYQANNNNSSIDSWKRITEQIPNCTLMAYPLKPNDIIQGQSNDCYFLSAVAAIAEREYRIKNIFGSLQINKWGVYMCKLFYDGIYQEVVVDDYFPYTLNPDTNQLKLYCSKPNNGTDIWVLILEKCWAKLRGGYSKIEFNYNFFSLWALLGSPVLGQFDTTLYKKDSLLSKNLFDKLIKFHDDHNYVITSSVMEKYALKEFNLSHRHSYTVLGLFRTKDQNGELRLVQIRNPLKNNKMPFLAYNFNDPFWSTVSEKQKDRLQFWRIEKQGQDGIFYLKWQDYIDLFTQICISQIDDNAHYLYQKVNVQKGKPIFLSLQLNSCNDKFHLYIVQKYIQKELLQNQSYNKIRVLVAEVTSNFKNQKEYKYVCSKSYFNVDNITNYFYVDLGDLRVGKYQVRIFVTLEPNLNEAQMVLGYYSSNNFTAKVVDYVNDSEFMSKTLLNRARSLDFTKPDQKRKILKEKLVNADGWRCIQNIFQSNICYIAYHIDHSSPNETYSIEIDSRKDGSLMMLQGAWFKQKTLKLPIKKGEQALIPYYYTSKWTTDQDIDPNVYDKRIIPNPQLIPLK